MLLLRLRSPRFWKRCQIFALLAALLSVDVGAAEKPVYARRVGEIFDDRNVRALAQAAAAGDVAEIEEIVAEKGVPVDSPGYRGITPLWWAVQRQNLDGYRKLLELGADPNHQWADGNSVMNHVVRLKSPEYLRLALEHGGDPNLFRPNPAGGGDTPLFQALYDAPANDNVETIKLLISEGADVNFANLIGETPLIAAVGLRLFDVALYMLENGGDYMVLMPTGIHPVLDRIQISIERDQGLSEHQLEYRRQVVNFLASRGIDLSEYSRSVTFPRLGYPAPRSDP